MARKLTSEMTPQEIEENRAYMRDAQAKRREKKVKAGLCPSCGMNTPINGRKTCQACIKKSSQRDALRGYPMRPSVMIRRTAKHLQTIGEKITITGVVAEVADYDGVEYEKAYVKEVLVRHGYYEPVAKSINKAKKS